MPFTCAFNCKGSWNGIATCEKQENGTIMCVCHPKFEKVSDNEIELQEFDSPEHDYEDSEQDLNDDIEVTFDDDNDYLILCNCCLLKLLLRLFI